MYSLPSTSKMWEPSPRAMNGGLPPTLRKARTGELTPPGINCRARSKSASDRECFTVVVSSEARSSLLRKLGVKGVHALGVVPLLVVDVPAEVVGLDLGDQLVFGNAHFDQLAPARDDRVQLHLEGLHIGLGHGELAWRGMAGDAGIEIELQDIAEHPRGFDHAAAERVVVVGRDADYHVPGLHDFQIRVIDDGVAAGVRAAEMIHLDLRTAQFNGVLLGVGDVRQAGLALRRIVGGEVRLEAYNPPQGKPGLPNV